MQIIFLFLSLSSKSKNKKLKKIILLVRVSTKYQNFESQTNELVKYAERDGYVEDDWIIIEDKESGSKLSDEERQGLTKMYAAIRDPDNQIECVYVLELSRLSRKPETLYKLKRFFTKRKIDLRVKDKGLRLLDPDTKKVNETTDIIFGIYIGLCESENKTRNERTRRGKIYKAEKGYYTGGNVKFG